MPAPCVTCKPGDATFHASAVENTGCEVTYQAVDDCMKKHNGRVSACKEVRRVSKVPALSESWCNGWSWQQWDLFRKCHEDGKSLKAQQKDKQ